MVITGQPKDIQDKIDAQAQKEKINQMLKPVTEQKSTAPTIPQEQHPLARPIFNMIHDELSRLGHTALASLLLEFKNLIGLK